MAKKTKEVQEVKTTNDIKVEFDVPVPPIERHSGRPLKYPFDKLTKIGASFFWDVKANTLKNAAVAWSKRNNKGFKFEIRSVTEDGVKGTRIFRKE